jgi:hypothetical protein
MRSSPRSVLRSLAPLLALVVHLVTAGTVVAQGRPATPVPPVAPGPGGDDPALLPGVGAFDEVPTAGLVAHWSFDERGGDLACDSASGLDGVIEGATRAWEEPGPALVFDGVDDRVMLPPEALEVVGALDMGTIALWFRFGHHEPEEIQPLLHYGIDDPADVDSMLIVEVGHNTIHGTVENRKVYITWVTDGVLPLCFDSGFDLDEGRWYHFVAVVGPDGNTGYLDGVELVDRHYNFGGPDDVLFFSDIPAGEQLSLGYGKSVDSKSFDFMYTDGALADVRIYDRPLTADEVEALYEAAPPDARPEASAQVGTQH